MREKELKRVERQHTITVVYFDYKCLFTESYIASMRRERVRKSHKSAFLQYKWQRERVRGEGGGEREDKHIQKINFLKPF